jgi:hypothetical protein
MHSNYVGGLPMGHELEMSAQTHKEVGSHLARHIMSQPPLRKQFVDHRLYLPSLDANPYYNCLLTVGQYAAMVSPSSPSIWQLTVYHRQSTNSSADGGQKKICVDWWVEEITGWLLDSETRLWLTLNLGPTGGLPIAREVIVFLELFVTQFIDWEESGGEGEVSRAELPEILTTAAGAGAEAGGDSPIAGVL